MKIRIYQINSDRDEKRVKFTAHNLLEKFQGSSKVNSKIYDKVYDANVNCKNLEEVYRMFNLERPSDFKGHSLSVSDVVEVYESDTVPKGFYFCDSIGFKNILFDTNKCRAIVSANDEEDMEI